MSEVVYEPSGRYIVQIGEVDVEEYSGALGIGWSFHGRFVQFDDAQSCCDQAAEDNEHVRVIAETEGAENDR